MDDPVMLVLRLLHIGFGVLWVGAAWTFHFFIIPALRTAGHETEKQVMDILLRQRKVALIILSATIVTVGAGATMLVIDISRFGVEAWFGSGFGIGITIGAIAAILAFSLGPTLILPATKRMEQIGAAIEAQGGPPTAEQNSELGALTARLDRVLRYDTLLLIVAVAFMATARYL